MYADPGSGLMLLQIITATAVAALYRFRKRLRGLLHPAPAPEPTSPKSTADEP
jgi:hypothetical protein